MSAVDELLELAAELKQKGVEGELVRKLLGEINLALGDILACMEKPEEKDDAEATRAIVEAINNLKFTPEVVVNVPQAPSPVVNVAAPQVKVLPPPPPTASGWRLVVTDRDGNGAIRSISISPEQ